MNKGQDDSRQGKPSYQIRANVTRDNRDRSNTYQGNYQGTQRYADISNPQRPIFNTPWNQQPSHRQPDIMEPSYPNEDPYMEPSPELYRPPSYEGPDFSTNEGYNRRNAPQPPPQQNRRPNPKPRTNPPPVPLYLPIVPGHVHRLGSSIFDTYAVVSEANNRTFQMVLWSAKSLGMKIDPKTIMAPDINPSKIRVGHLFKVKVQYACYYDEHSSFKETFTAMFVDHVEDEVWKYVVENDSILSTFFDDALSCSLCEIIQFEIPMGLFQTMIPDSAPKLISFHQSKQARNKTDPPPSLVPPYLKVHCYYTSLYGKRWACNSADPIFTEANIDSLQSAVFFSAGSEPLPLCPYSDFYDPKFVHHKVPTPKNPKVTQRRQPQIFPKALAGNKFQLTNIPANQPEGTKPPSMDDIQEFPLLEPSNKEGPPFPTKEPGTSTSTSAKTAEAKKEDPWFSQPQRTNRNKSLKRFAALCASETPPFQEILAAVTEMKESADETSDEFKNFKENLKVLVISEEELEDEDNEETSDVEPTQDIPDTVEDKSETGSFKENLLEQESEL